MVKWIVGHFSKGFKVVFVLCIKLAGAASYSKFDFSRPDLMTKLKRDI